MPMLRYSATGGAATVSAAVLAIAKLKVPCVSCHPKNPPILLLITASRINIVVLTPLTENLPGPTANKPGDTYVLQS